MKIEIYSSNGELRIVAIPADGDRESAGIQEDGTLSLSFTAFECVALEVYDYADYLGRRYILAEGYKPKMNARNEWVYSLEMKGVESLAADTLMTNPTDGADNPQVTLTAPAAEHAALIVANLNRRAGAALWHVGQVIDTPYIDIDYTGKYASEAISELATQARTEWWFEDYTLNFCRCEYGEPIRLEYGDALLSGITRTTADGVDFFTRLFPLGSSRNIDLDKYGYSRLQLPDRSAYVDSRTELGIIEHFEENAFAGIYPRRTGRVGAVRSEKRTGGNGVEYTVYFFTDPDIPFNPNDYEIGGLVKNVTFQSGELRGRVFEVNYDTARKEFEIITVWPYDNGVQLPTPPLIPATGDEYILWNISMPESYYPAAEKEYREAVDAFIAESQKDIAVFSASTDYTVVADRAAEFRPGRRVRIVSDEYFPDGGYRDTRIISVSRSIANPGSMTLTMSDVISSGRLKALESGLNEVRGATSKISTNLSSENASLARKLDKSVFFDLFEKVNIGAADAPVYAIRAKYGLYSDGFLSARGRNASGSGGTGGGATALSELNDVSLSAALAKGDILVYDGTHWANVAQASLRPDLTGYATQSWVESRGYALQSALAAHAGDTAIHVSAADRTKWNKVAADFAAITGTDSDTVINKWEEVVAFLDTYTEADTLAGLLSNKADKAVSIKAGTGLTGGGTLAADRTLSLATSGVKAGTYAKITVDAYGRVTAGTTLAAADIPALDISNISNLSTTLAAKLDKSVFDDLFEKVNIGTASAPVYAIRAKYGLYSDSFLSARGRNASGSGGGSTDSGDYDRLDVWADYTADKAGYVLSAALGYSLYTDVNSLKSGAAVNVVTAGAGNAVTAITKSGTVITATRGASFSLSDHKHGLLHHDLGVMLPSTTDSTGWDMINPTYDGFILKSIRAQREAPSWIEPNYAAGICFGGGDTKGVLSVDYDKPYIRFAGGNGTAPVWWVRLIGTRFKSYNLDDLAGTRLNSSGAITDLNAAALENAANVVINSYNNTAVNRPVPSNNANLVVNLNKGFFGTTGAYSTQLAFPDLDRFYFRRITAGGFGGWLPIAFTTDITWGNLLGKPTTLSGYGITDSYTRSDADSRFARVCRGYTMAVGVKYILLGTLPASSSSTFDSLHISGDIGAWDGVTKGVVDIYCGRRGSAVIRGYVNHHDFYTWDIGINAAGQVYLILKSQYCAYNLNLYANQATIDWTGAESTPTDTNFTLLSESPKVSRFTNDSFAGNAASATRLATPRTLWGRSFDGMADVSGDMVGVGSITAAGRNTVQFAAMSTATTWASDYGHFKALSATAGYCVGFGPTENGYGLIQASQIGKGAIPLLLNPRGGRVGIGVSSPEYPLDVAGEIRATTKMYITHADNPAMTLVSGSQTCFFQIYNSYAYMGFGSSKSLRIDPTGNISAPGTIHSAVGVWSDGYMSARGQNSTSDVRLKTPIGDVRLTLVQIAAAPAYRFAWKSDGTVAVGSTSQYWQSIVPELTHILPDGKHLGLDYGKAALLSVVSVAREVLSLDRRVTLLEAENKTLKRQLNRMIL